MLRTCLVSRLKKVPKSLNCINSGSRAARGAAQFPRTEQRDSPSPFCFQRLEHELDFIKAQQTELEEVLRPLEASLASAPPGDAERERTYQGGDAFAGCCGR